MEEPETRVILKDGAQISLRSVGSCDKKGILDGFDHLSARSRYSRYHTVMKRLPESYLDGLTIADNHNDVVVIAHLTEDKPDKGVGLGRYVRLGDEDGVAEFSITVIDEYQNRGLGAALLDYLVEHARHNHISVLRGYVLAGNEAMIGLLKGYNSKVASIVDSTLCYEIDPTAANNFSTGPV
jgi:ribosomal protein S18 acetylase RimI-like enzyme